MQYCILRAPIKSHVMLPLPITGNTHFDYMLLHYNTTGTSLCISHLCDYFATDRLCFSPSNFHLLVTASIDGPSWINFFNEEFQVVIYYVFHCTFLCHPTQKMRFSLSPIYLFTNLCIQGLMISYFIKPVLMYYHFLVLIINMFQIYSVGDL